MITYIGVGPGRSGSSSFYDMCSNIKGLNPGKKKEPITKNYYSKGYTLGYEKLFEYNFDFDCFIENWKFDKSEDCILIDGLCEVVKMGRYKKF